MLLLCLEHYICGYSLVKKEKNAMDYPVKINKLEVELKLSNYNTNKIERFLIKPTALTFSGINKTNQTSELVDYAVTHDGRALEHVYKKLLTYDVCLKAVKNTGLALRFVPEQLITDEIVDAALEHSIYFADSKDGINDIYRFCSIELPKQYINREFYSYPISYVPYSLINDERLKKSIQYSPFSITELPRTPKELYELAVSIDGLSLKFIPKRILNKRIINSAINSNPLAVAFVPQKYLTEEIAHIAFKYNPLTVQFLPSEFVTKEMCIKAIKHCSTVEFKNKNPFSTGKTLRVFDSFPEYIRNDREVIDTFISGFGTTALLNHYKQIENRSDNEAVPLPFTADSYSYISKQEMLAELQLPEEEKKYTINPISLNIPQEVNNKEIIVKKNNDSSSIINVTAPGVNEIQKMYYISDIHLEHQLKQVTTANQIDNQTMIEFIDNKIQEMVMNTDKQGILLVGGDVTDSVELSELFYRRLRYLWYGSIIYILGNHELWNIGPKTEEKTSKSIDEIIALYNHFEGCSFLHNSLFILYKNKSNHIINEEQILNASDEDLSDICIKSSIIILGGIGFSGLNEYFNATKGLYLKTITSLEEDLEQSKRFKKIYDKVKRCAEKIKVIVLTHNPVTDWTTENYNPNWIYINGHTHRNTIIRKKDGTTVLSDNQIGYKPCKWHLNCIKLPGYYDPLRYLPDGIHSIKNEIYIDICRGRGISTKGYNAGDGEIIALKRKGFYCFLLKKTKGLFYMEGGRIKKINNNTDIYYYYNNMLHLINKYEAVRPFYDYLVSISNEVKSFNGIGKIHGCIVDIGFLTHLYVNPFDGKITPYYAEDTKTRLIYTLQELIQKKEPKLYNNFISCYDNMRLQLLTKQLISTEVADSTPPIFDEGFEIYKISEKLRKIQYIFDQNILREWDENVLKTDFSTDNLYLTNNNLVIP